MNFFNIFKHLLPKAEAWKIIIEKFLRKFFEGLSDFPQDIKDFTDNVYNDVFPKTTREIEKFEQQFNITTIGTEQERRDAITGAWRAQGGQGKDYLQNVIQDSGFTNVFIHEWWTDLGGGNYDTKNPNEYLLNNNPLIYKTYCGNPDSDCGNPDADCGALLIAIFYITYCGNPDSDCGNPDADCGALSFYAGYILVNKGPHVISKIYTTDCGNPDSDCGNPDAECGVFVGYIFPEVEYQVPVNEDDFRFIIYVGAENFPEHVSISESKKNQLENIILSYFPSQQWIGMLIDYI